MHKCAPGCPGWVCDASQATIERCDECGRFDNDVDAAAHFVYLASRKLPNTFNRVASQVFKMAVESELKQERKQQRGLGL